MRRILAQADQMGALYISGELVDRVARSGMLVPLDPHKSIWPQYPIGCDLTSRVLKGYSHKVAAAKGNVRLMPGNHEVSSGSDPWRWAPELIAIHHFKWDDTVVKRLSSRLTPDWKARCSWWRESERCLSFIQNQCKLDLTILRTFDFGPGYHQVNDEMAWHFVHCLRYSNPEWVKRWGVAPSRQRVP